MVAFSIDAITDAGWSMFGEREFSITGMAEQLAAHDLAVVKPALLYADDVTLYSGNFFILSQIDAYLTRTKMPAQAVALMAHYAALRPEDLRRIGIGNNDLPSQEEAANTLRDWKTGIVREESDESYDFVREFLIPLSERWAPYYSRFFPKYIDALREARSALFSAQLHAAIDAHILRVVPHTEVPPNPNMMPLEVLFGEKPEEYRERAAEEIAARIEISDNAVLLDPWSSHIAQLLEVGKRSALERTGADAALNLLVQIPTIQRASVNDIVDIRTELHAPLVRFRAAMAKASREAPISGKERTDYFRSFYLEEVEPALVEIDEKRRENSFLESLLDTVKDPRELIVPAGGLAIALAGPGGTLAGIAGGIVGVATPVVRGLLERRRREREIARNRFYFLHRVGSKQTL
jgi:hypothetical protein